jgi:serine/threonine protein kinase
MSAGFTTFGAIGGQHYLSMEYLDGEDLKSVLRRIGRLPHDKAIEFTRKICAGLAAAHERGVLHRDLKPANIMIDGRGQVRIANFGLAALAAEIPPGDLRIQTNNTAIRGYAACLSALRSLASCSASLDPAVMTFS